MRGIRGKNEALVGLVVVGGLLLAVIGGIWLSGKPFGQEQTTLRAAFLEVGALSEGSPVKYRGVRIGRVTEIALEPTGNGVIVTMQVAPDVRFPEDAGVLVSPESFFGDWQAAVVSRAAVRDLPFTEIRGRGLLPGATLPDITQLTAVAASIAEDIQLLSDRIQIAFTEETARDIAETVENVQQVSDQLEGFFDQQTRTYAQVSANVLESTANIRDATAQAETAAVEVRRAFTTGDVQQALSNARRASENLAAFSSTLNDAASGVPGLVQRADTTLQTVGRTAASLDSAVQTLTPQLREVGPTMVEARNALITLNRALQLIEQGDGSLGRLMQDPALYEETQRSIATLRRLLADIQANPGKYLGELRVFE